jgi:hypothetical protein
MRRLPITYLEGAVFCLHTLKVDTSCYWTSLGRRCYAILKMRFVAVAVI